MKNKKLKFSLLMALLIIVLILGIIIFYSRNLTLKVAFLDVGQGDAILLSQGNVQVLVDGGRGGKILLERLGEQIPFWDRNIEAIIATHPDSDHIGGLPDALKIYRAKTIIETRAESQSETFVAWRKATDQENAKHLEGLQGMKFLFPGGAKAEILYPFASVPVDAKDKNKDSIVLKVSFGKNDFLLTGDLTQEGENILVDSGENLEAEILKAGHHGSRSSSGEKFLDAVRPREAVISAGKNNSYGHPHREVLERLRARGIKIFRTDEFGTIVYKCPTPEENCALLFNK